MHGLIKNEQVDMILTNLEILKQTKKKNITIVLQYCFLIEITCDLL